jgi:hypothetical protein
MSGTRLRKVNEDAWLGRIVPDSRGSKRNLFVLKASDDAVTNLGKKGASEAVARRLLEKVGAAKDDTILVGTDAEEPVSMAMGILRLEMGKELKLIDENTSVVDTFKLANELLAMKEIDAVIDTVGGETLDRSYGVLKRGGIVVSSAAPPSNEKAEQHGVRAIFFLVQVTKARLTMIGEMIDAGALQSEVGEVLWLDEARKGHEMLEGAPHRRGKIVIKVAD